MLDTFDDARSFLGVGFNELAFEVGQNAVWGKPLPNDAEMLRLRRTLAALTLFQRPSTHNFSKDL